MRQNLRSSWISATAIWKTVTVPSWGNVRVVKSEQVLLKQDVKAWNEYAGL